MTNTLEVVVGAQFGSEAKGHVVQRLTERALGRVSAPQVIRVAGPNAGHTGYDAHGRRWALRQVPVAALVDGPVQLGIAAGSEIDLPVLLDEIDQLTVAGLMRDKFLWISGESTMLHDHHKGHENGEGGSIDMVARIGSTGKGVGAARSDRIMRVGQRLCDDEAAIDELTRRGVAIADAEHSPDMGVVVHTIIEGTQGYGLGLHAGYYPQCTSSDCRAQDFIAMAGIAPWRYQEIKIWAVARMFPIRVAGNSGSLRNETTWEDLGLPEERTTVTNKVRRVGYPDWDLVRRAVRANGGAPRVRLAVTMVDQMFPEVRDRQMHEFTREAADKVWTYLTDVEREVQAKVGMITTGPSTASIMG